MLGLLFNQVALDAPRNRSPPGASNMGGAFLTGVPEFPQPTKVQ